MKRDIYALLAQRVREERKKAGLTMEELASLAGISASFLAYIETRGSKPSLATVQKLSDGLGIPIAALFQAMPPARTGRTYSVGRRFELLVKDRDAEQQEAILHLVRSVTRRIPPRRGSRQARRRSGPVVGGPG